MPTTNQERRALTMDEQRAAAKLKRIWTENRKRLNLTQEKLAKGYRTKQGERISQGAIGHYLNGRVPLNAWACSQFADALQIDVAEFAPESVLRELEELGDPLKHEDFIDVRYYRRKFYTGNIVNKDRQNEEKIILHTPWVLAEGLPPEKLTAVEAADNSMAPKIMEGDSVIVRRDKQTIESGKVYALDYGNHQRIVRIFRNNKRWLTLLSDNAEKKEAPEIIRTGDLEDIKIIGLVVLCIGRVY